MSERERERGVCFHKYVCAMHHQCDTYTIITLNQTLIRTSIGIVLSQQVEQCQSLLSASVANPQCSPVGGNCTGLRCEQRGNALNGSSVSFAVVKCEDPVIVNLTIQSAALRQRSFTRNETVLLGGSSYLSVAMRRNASYLQFQVIFFFFFYIHVHLECMHAKCNRPLLYSTDSTDPVFEGLQNTFK